MVKNKIRSFNIFKKNPRQKLVEKNLIFFAITLLFLFILFVFIYFVLVFLFQDVIKLYTQLRNPIGLHLVQDTLFNHIDFTIDPKAYKLIYRKMIKMMNSLSL